MRQAMGFLDLAPTKADKVELIKTLQSITEGKVRSIQHWARGPCGWRLRCHQSSGCHVQSSSVDGGGSSQALTAPAIAQIYVEIERARLTRQLAAIQEADGDVGTAADTLQEVAVVRA